MASRHSHFGERWGGWHNWERKKKIGKRDWGEAEKASLWIWCKREEHKKPIGPKLDLINPTGPLLEVVEVNAETTVEGRCILMMGPV